jgi:hypothetical protein
MASYVGENFSKVDEHSYKEALEHGVQFTGVYYWLDSKTALCWINNR